MSTFLRRATAGTGTLRAFRLADLPDRVRQYGVSEFERIEFALGVTFYESLDEVTEVARVADHPSDRVYYIPESAYEKIARKFRLDREEEFVT